MDATVGRRRTREWMRRLLFWCALVAVATVLAGFYGMAHNQVSYRLSPEYFHNFKFDQFQVAEDLRTPFGASLVGWAASWWMGALVGAPLAALALRAPTVADTLSIFGAGVVRVFAHAVGIATVFTIIRVALGVPARPDVVYLYNLDDPQAFSNAMTMHNATYLGALLGALSAWIMAWRRGRALRRQPEAATADSRR